MPHAHITLTQALDEDGFARFSDALRRSFDVQAIEPDADGITVAVADNVSPADLQKTLKQILRARRYADSGCIFQRQVQGRDRGDPQPMLEAKGEVMPIGPGLFAFRGGFLRVRTALDIAIRAIASRCDAEELSYPPLWPIPVLQSINYLHDFPQLVVLAPGVAPGYEARKAFAERFDRASGVKAIACTAENGLAPAANVLAPTVCDCCYWLLRGQQDVADQTFTMHGQVFRNEASPDGRIDRLTAYTMREIVMVGSEAFVLAKRELLLNEITMLIAKLDLACDIKAADDPFFCNDALQKAAYQNLAQLKYEVDVPLFEDRRTAIASINLHNDFFGKNYDFKNRDGGHAFSACVGFGYERVTYALFCRHGVDVSAWPQAVRDFLELS